MDITAPINLVELATELTVAWLGNESNRISTEEVPTFLRSMHATLVELSAGAAPGEAAVGTADEPTHFPQAISVRKSLASKDHIISMIDGKPYRTLRRHLSTHGLTPDEYRARYGLKPDYPMVAQSYSEARREMAKSIGLGSKGRQARKPGPNPSAPTADPKPKARRRDKVANA